MFVDVKDKDFDVTHRLLMPDGSIKFVHVLSHALKDAAGNLEIVGALMDVTEKALVQIAGAGKRPVVYCRDFKLGARHSTLQAQVDPWTPRRPSPNCPLRMRCINSMGRRS